jgi:hypothetical protein
MVVDHFNERGEHYPWAKANLEALLLLILPKMEYISTKFCIKYSIFVHASHYFFPP